MLGGYNLHPQIVWYARSKNLRLVLEQGSVSFKTFQINCQSHGSEWKFGKNWPSTFRGDVEIVKS